MSLARRSEQDPTKTEIWKMVEVEIIAVNGTIAVVNTGATILQANISKLRRPLDTVDLEELPDSRERGGAPVLWLSCEGQIDVWEMFSDNTYLSAILDRQGLEVVGPIDVRTTKADSLWPQLVQGFWQNVVQVHLVTCSVKCVEPTTASLRTGPGVPWVSYQDPLG